MRYFFQKFLDSWDLSSHRNFWVKCNNGASHWNFVYKERESSICFQVPCKSEVKSMFVFQYMDSVLPGSHQGPWVGERVSRTPDSGSDPAGPHLEKKIEIIFELTEFRNKLMPAFRSYTNLYRKKLPNIEAVHLSMDADSSSKQRKICVWQFFFEKKRCPQTGVKICCVKKIDPNARID